MSNLVILPVKNLKQSKSRLSCALGPEEREALAFNLLKRTIRVLKSSRGIDHILIVSRDTKIHSFAREENILFLQEEGMGLNQALEQATRWSMSQRVSGILILSLDIPYLSKQDIDSIVEMGSEKEQIVIIAPDQEMKGTNAVFVKPPGVLQYQFGGGSFRRHWKQAENSHIERRIYFSRRMSFDLDAPSHFQWMIKRGLSRSDLCQGK